MSRVSGARRAGARRAPDLDRRGADASRRPDLSRCQARSGCQAAIAPAREAAATGPVGGRLGSGEMADHLLGGASAWCRPRTPIEAATPPRLTAIRPRPQATNPLRGSLDTRTSQPGRDVSRVRAPVQPGPAAAAASKLAICMALQSRARPSRQQPGHPPPATNLPSFFRRHPQRPDPPCHQHAEETSRPTPPRSH